MELIKKVNLLGRNGRHVSRVWKGTVRLDLDFHISSTESLVLDGTLVVLTMERSILDRILGHVGEMKSQGSIPDIRRVSSIMAA